MALINCNNLTLGYEGKALIENIEFSVKPGDYLCIVGENGSGKSTLIKTLLGLISPLSGTITFGDGLKQNEIGYLPQQTQIQKDFPASVKEVVLSGCLNSMGMRPFYGQAEKELAARVMSKLHISDLSKRSYRTLSGGQQQRVLLARALCATQKLLLLDEPVTGLDPQAATGMYELLEKLNREDGITIIMISHDVDAAIDYATNIFHIGKQATLFYGSCADYLASGLIPHHECTKPSAHKAACTKAKDLRDFDSSANEGGVI